MLRAVDRAFHRRQCFGNVEWRLFFRKGIMHFLLGLLSALALLLYATVRLWRRPQYRLYLTLLLILDLWVSGVLLYLIVAALFDL